MAAHVRQTILELSAEDRELLDRLAGYLQTSRAQVLRWSLRSFGVVGQWSLDPKERNQVLRGIKPVDIGPMRLRGG